MDAGIREDGCAEVLDPGAEVPGIKDSSILLMDSLLTLLQLVKAEAVQALHTVPALLELNLYRAPAYLLTWVSFCALAACGVHALTGSLLYSLGTVFLMQLGVTLALERRARHLHERMDFPESRKGFEALQAKLRERFQSEHGN